MHKPTLVVILSLTMATGCYHATINTGRPLSTQIVEEPFASSWVYGLVPPKTVEAGERCPNGVARVETQQSFVNGLVGVLTFGIYTPMNIKVTCAAGDDDLDAAAMMDVPANATLEETQAAFKAAADLAVEGRHPTLVRFLEQ